MIFYITSARFPFLSPLPFYPNDGHQYSQQNYYFSLRCVALLPGSGNVTGLDLGVAAGNGTLRSSVYRLRCNATAALSAGPSRVEEDSSRRMVYNIDWAHPAGCPKQVAGKCSPPAPAPPGPPPPPPAPGPLPPAELAKPTVAQLGWSTEEIGTIGVWHCGTVALWHCGNSFLIKPRIFACSRA